ncbi:lactococcin 972 family bacteriocin [Staphylococcus aureus]
MNFSTWIINSSLCIYRIREGGTWSHGVGSKYVWSYYYHGHKGHGATAIGKYRSFSGYTRAGVKAKASATKHNWWVNRAYYNIY